MHVGRYQSAGSNDCQEIGELHKKITFQKILRKGNMDMFTLIPTRSYKFLLLNQKHIL